MMKKINTLVSICKQSQEKLKDWLFFEILNYYPRKKIKRHNKYLYVKGDLPVCLVAHLDTVHFKDPVDFLFDPVLHNLFSPTGIGGDDRCGVYIILELLKRGIRPSIIFCCDEEIGAIGAFEFTKVYSSISNVNWFLEFDRRGRNDVVCYDDGNDELTKVFEEFGFKSAWGSFSDISELAPAYGISAVNISSGYYNAHTPNEYINLDDLDWIIDTSEKVLKSDYVYRKYTYKPSTRYLNYTKTNDYSSYAPYDNWLDDYDLDVCDMCGKHKKFEELEKTEFGWLCMDCIKEYELAYCASCGEYVLPNKEGKCDKCGEVVFKIYD